MRSLLAGWWGGGGGRAVRLIHKYIALSEIWQAPINIYQVPTVRTIPSIHVEKTVPGMGSLPSDSESYKRIDAARAWRPRADGRTHWELRLVFAASGLPFLR